MIPRTTARRRNLVRLLAALFVGGAMTTPVANAITLYWDGNDTNANANGGNGAWTTTTPTNWDTLAFGGANSGWANGDLAVFGGTAGTATIGAGGVTVGGLTFNITGYTLAAGTNGLTFSTGTNNINFFAPGATPTATISGTVGGTGADLVLRGNPGASSTLTFSGISAGGWTGTTTIGSGTTLTTTTTSGNVNQVLNSTSGITLNGGTIQFNRATNAQLNAISDTATITVNGGGTFSATSADAGGVNANETIGAVTLNSGQFNVGWTNGGSSGTTQTLGGFTRSGSNSAVAFFGPATIANGRTFITGQATTAANEIIGAWATYGSAIATQTDYATYNITGGVGNANGIQGAGITASAETAWSTSHAATSNYTLTNAVGSALNGRLTATRNINTLRNTSAASAAPTIDITLNTVTIAGSSFVDGDVVTFGGTAPGGLATGTAYYVVGASGTTFQVAAASGGAAIDLTSAGTSNVTGGITLSSGNNLGTYGILNGSAAALAIGRSGTGVVTLPSAVSDNLYLTAGNAGIVVNAPIANNGAGVLTLVKNGLGNLFLSSTNTYTGGTVVNAGTLTLNTAGSWVSGQNLTIGGTSSVTASVGALSGGTLTVNQGATGTITGSSGITFTTTSGAGQIIYGGGSSATLALGNASGFTGNVILPVGSGGTNPRPTVTFTSIADTAGSFIGWGGAGNGDSNQRAQIELVGNVGAVTFNNRQLAVLPTSAGGSTARSMTLRNNNATAANALVINTDFINNSTRTNAALLLGGSNTGNNTFAGSIGNSTINNDAFDVYKEGAGKWILSGANTFTGGIAINGTLSVGTLNEPGVAGPLGMGSTGIQLGGREDRFSGTGTENILANNTAGTLEYTGGVVTSTRSFFIGDTVAGSTGGGTIANNGSGAITFSNATFNATQAGITGARTLVLGGSNGGEIQGVIQNNAAGGTIALSKAGTGTWTLSGINTYSGGTTIGNNTANVGTVNITNSSALGSGAVTIVSNAGSGNLATLTLNSATGITVSNNFSTSGEGQGGNGIIRNVTGNNTMSGTITLIGGGGGTRLQSDGGSLEFTNTIAPSTTGRFLFLAGSSTGTISGAVNDGAGANTLSGLTKQGSGTWTLSNNANTYTGPTLVSAGKLTIASTGNINSTSGVTINGATANFNYNSATAFTKPVTLTQGTISGTGTINSAITVGTGASLSPGNSPGIQPYGATQTWLNGGTYVWEVNNWTATPTAGTDFDQIQITGGLDIAGLSSGTFPANTYRIDINGLTAGNAIGAVPGFDNTQARSWTILTTTTGIAGQAFAANLFTLADTNFTGANALGGGNFSLTTANAGNDLVLNFNPGGGGTPNFSFTNTSDVTLNVLRNGSGISANKTIQNTGTANGTATLNNTNSNLSVSGVLNINASSSEVQTLQPSSTATNGSSSGTLTVLVNSGGSNVVNTTVNVGNATFNAGNSQILGTARVLSTIASNINYPTANWSSNTDGLTETSGPAALDTTATVLRYDNTTGTGTETVSMQWRTRTTAEANLANTNAVLSDIVNLTGMYSGSENNTTGTGVFVLQMSYLQSTLTSAGLSENSIATSGELRLGWNDGGVWKTAGLGNQGVGGGTATFVGAVAYDPMNPLHNVLGAYGVDPSDVNGGVVWAVLNHNSEFAVIPEPSTLVLGGLALLGLAGVGLRRRRMAKPQA